MDRAAAIKIVKREIKAKYGTQKAASAALGLTQLQISRVMNGITERISPQLLDMAGLTLIEQPPVTYRRKV